MVVRVRVHLERGGKGLSSPAVVNSAYEAETCQVLLPIKVARKLGIPLENARRVPFETAGGLSFMYVLPNALEVQLETERGGQRVKADAVISEFERQILLNDKLAGKLGIRIEDVGEAFGL